MALPERIETSRLAGHRVTAVDLPGWRSVFADPAVARTLTRDGQPLDDEAVRRRLDEAMGRWAQPCSGEWAFVERASGRFVSRANLIAAPAVVGDHEIEIGWAVVSERWREGFGTEMAAAVIDAAWSDPDFADVASIVAFTLPHNLGSRGVMENLDFSYERRIVHAGMPHVLYRLRRPA